MPAPVAMPAATAQNMNMMSMGSLMEVRKRMMDSAPTMPRVSTTLLVTTHRIRALIMVMAARVTP